MYPPTVTRDHLLDDISPDELSAIQTALVDPSATRVARTIAEASARVTAYTVRYQLADDHFIRLARTLTLWELQTATVPYGKLEEDHYRQRKYSEAMDELRDIRDGKFPDLTLATSMPAGLAASSGASWGSADVLGSRIAASTAVLVFAALSSLASPSSLSAQPYANDTHLRVAQRCEVLLGGDPVHPYQDNEVACYWRWERLLLGSWGGYRAAMLTAGLPAGADPNADPDGDGQPNLLEYALGSNPNNNLSVGVCRVSFNDDPNPLTPDANFDSATDVLRIYFDPLPDPNLIFTAQAISALSMINVWTTLATGAGDSFAPGYVSIDDVQTTATGMRFLRLKVALD